MSSTLSTLRAHPAAEVFPLLGQHELRALADDIAANGLIEPVWTYADPDLGEVVLDGRNRIAACAMAGVEADTRRYHGDDPITFAVSANSRRRHLTDGQRAAAGSRLEPLYAEESARARAAAAVRGNRSRKSPVRADLPEPGELAPRARDRAAADTGSSGRAVAQYKRVAQADPVLAQQVFEGQVALDRAERIVRDRVAEQRRVDQAKREAAEGEAVARVDIRLGDFREVLGDARDVDAIITDPPYPHEFLPLLADLAAFADRVLKPDGILAVLFGQAYLPEVYELLDGGRPYRWTACYLTSGPGYVPHGDRIRVQSNWKPLLVYGGGPRFADVVRSEGADADSKNNHKWGQDYSAFHTIVERLTSRGQTVCDPFMGAGTTLLAAHALGRHAVGCDIEPEHVETALRRLA